MEHAPQADPLNKWRHSLSPFLDLNLPNENNAEAALGWKMAPSRYSTHIWSAKMPLILIPGTYRLEVYSKDRFGEVAIGNRVFRIR